MVDKDSDDSDEDSIQNIMFVGDSYTGKTSIIDRIIDNPFKDTFEASIGVDFMSKYIRFRGQNIHIRIWDTSGQEKFKTLIPYYARPSLFFFIVYDVSKRSSFENVLNWISFVRSINKTSIILCGNKIDLEREVETNEGEKLAKNEGLFFFECSAKTNENIKKMFYSCIGLLPPFGIDPESERENLMKELLNENEKGDFKEKGENQESIAQPEGKINGNAN